MRPAKGRDAALPNERIHPAAGKRLSSPKVPLDHPRTIPASPGSFRNGTPEPSEDIPAGGTAGPPQSHVREPHGQELDSRETAIAPDRYPPEEEQGEEDQVDVLTREFWPWMKGKWDDINYAIHWYKRNRGEWTRQLKNARAARAAEERQQAKPEDQADRHRPGYEQGGEETEGVPVWDSSIPADPDARSLWDAVLADLQVRLPRPTFEGSRTRSSLGVRFHRRTEVLRQRGGNRLRVPEVSRSSRLCFNRGTNPHQCWVCPS